MPLLLRLPLPHLLHLPHLNLIRWSIRNIHVHHTVAQIHHIIQFCFQVLGFFGAQGAEEISYLLLLRLLILNIIYKLIDLSRVHVGGVGLDLL